MDDAIWRHLIQLSQWQADTSVYSRRRALIRLAAQLQVPLLEATREDLAAWRAGLNLSPQTIASYVSHAQGFYAWAVADGLLSASPAEDLRAPPVPRLVPRPVTEDDVALALATAQQPVRLMLILAGWCGLRAQEIALLRRNSILLNAVPPMIRVTWQAAKGWRERTVPLPAFVRAEMEAYGLPASGVVFRRRDGRPGPWSAARVSHVCNDHLHSLGIVETLHGWRHRYATKTLEISGDLRRVQELLGHASPATTAIYTRVDMRKAAAVVEQLPVPKLRSVC